MNEGPTPVGLGEAAGQSSLPEQVYYVLSESACPYLAGRRERKLITEVSGTDAAHRYSLLARAGFRRSHHVAYRPACEDCKACVPVRVDAERFTITRSLKRVARANAGLRVAEKPALATAEQYDMFSRYIASRHGDGEMADMTLADYRGMVEHSRIDTRMVEFRDESARLAAVCLVDWLDDGLSAVYSFFDPALARRSLGTYMVLWLIEAARGARLPYVYLGYWIQDAAKMAYKTRFQPLEAFGLRGWRDIGR